MKEGRTNKAKSALDRPINTLLVGDSTLRQVNLLGELGDRQTCLKISRRNTHLADLISPIEHFTDVYKDSLKTVILQKCIKDITHGSTERVIQIVEYLSRMMEDKGLSFVIVGPLPLPSLSSLSFSRGLCINNRLEKLSSNSNTITFINIFVTCSDLSC